MSSSGLPGNQLYFVDDWCELLLGAVYTYVMYMCVCVYIYMYYMHNVLSLYIYFIYKPRCIEREAEE